MISAVSLTGRAKAAASQFINNERGNFAVTFGASAMAVMACTGLALDYSRIAQTRSAMENAIDAGLLAAGSELADGEERLNRLRATFVDFFEANLENNGYVLKKFQILDFEADADTGELSADAKAVVDMALLGLTGNSTMDVRSSSEATISTKSVEVAMVLDVTGSMRGARLAALKTAASDAVDILLPKDRKNKRTRIALAPYSWSVNAGSYAYSASGGTSNACVTERAGRNAHNDASYGPRSGYVGALSNRCPSQRIRPLTSNRGRLKSDIASYQANGYTAGHIGIAWGYYMLSDQWNGLWPKKHDAKAYGDDVQKIAIVMTDGAFNTYYEGVSGNPVGAQQAKSSSAAVSLCSDMKAKKRGKEGVTVYSIAFQAPAQAKAVLRACASPDSGQDVHYFEASNAQELRDAFRRIATDIQKLRLSQ